MTQDKINIAELLKDCPKGMELNCTMYEDVFFHEITDDSIFPIHIKRIDGAIITLTKYGEYADSPTAKCVIFPKGKTTWEGFTRPFEDGDILSYQHKDFKNRTIYIYMQHSRMNTTYYVALSGNSNSEFMINDKEGHALNSYNDSVRFATEEEKQKLFDAIKKHGYKWNEETKTLEKLPKFKVGNRIKSVISSSYYTVVDIKNNQYFIKQDTEKYPYQIPFSNEINYELAPNKFDINTLKPFDKVLVRVDNSYWRIQFFERINKKNKNYPFVCMKGSNYKQCIPYEGNEHLLGTTDDCDEFYKNWEE